MQSVQSVQSLQLVQRNTCRAPKRRRPGMFLTVGLQFPMTLDLARPLGVREPLRPLLPRLSTPARCPSAASLRIPAGVSTLSGALAHGSRRPVTVAPAMTMTIAGTMTIAINQKRVVGGLQRHVGITCTHRLGPSPRGQRSNQTQATTGVDPKLVNGSGAVVAA